ncbi:protein kinase domain-containing protein [Sphingomonas soli]|uniref:protein kinase domain-containing protein n=1 Tax=Sphingomonas soli TaxID=266127 RepID=UPI00082A9BE1|nr:winged helix-turn-helix domain-containing protein [Sphingomonas soli]
MDAEFDEAGWMLRIAGQPAPLETKPLEVLHELLLRAGEVVTKNELLDAVWSGVTVVEGSLPTAISKLRRALGKSREHVIETVPRVGYRLIGPLAIETVESPLAPRFAFEPGDIVPGRGQWQLERALGDAGTADVWSAKHIKTSERRVFKFADAPDRLRSLKREAALSRLLFAGLGATAPAPALLEWNFDASPYFLEYAFGGHDLIAWAAEAGGLAAIPIEHRLAVAALIARAVASVHDLGVLHKDLKPANILIAQGDAGPVVKLADFGSGRLLDGTMLHAFRITDPGSLDAGLGANEPRSGTYAYQAPELVGDAMPTVKSDIYALGLILFQLASGDFAAALAPGWEDKIRDPVLREDIRLAGEGVPERRIASASELADRIERIDARRAEAALAAEQAHWMAERKRIDDRRRARLPWVRAAFGSMAIGLIVSSSLAVYAWTQRNHAIAAQAQADAGYDFIAQDVLASPDPAKSSADETVLQAIKRASLSIDQRFSGSPGVAARLHLSVARAFAQRSDVDAARSEFAKADQWFAKAGESESDDAAMGRIASIYLEATSGQPGRLEEAGRMIERERKRLGERADRGKTGFALAQAEGAYGYMSDLSVAERAFDRAVRIGEAPGSGVKPTDLLKARSSRVLTLMRLGRAGEAEPLARSILAESVRVRGADHPDTMVTRQHWLNSLSMLGRHQEVLAGSTPLIAAMQRQLGPAHRLTLGLHSTRFESFSALRRYDEASREAKIVWDGASAQNGGASHQALVGQIDYGASLCQTDRRAEGMAIAQQALASVRKAFETKYPLTHTIAFYAAECLIANRRYTEARALLETVDAKKVTELTGQLNFSAMLHLAQAETAFGTGDRKQAEALLSAALKDVGASSDTQAARRAEVLRRRLSAGK